MEEDKKTIAQLTEENARLSRELNVMKKMHKNCESKLKRITLVEETLNRIIDTNPLSIQVVDKNGRNKRVNDAFMGIFENKPLKNYSIFTDTQLIKQGLKPFFEQLKQGEVVYFPANYYNLHKLYSKLPTKNLWLKAVAFPVFADKKMPQRYVIIHQDITGEKLAEEEIKHINTKLQGMNKYIVEVREQERKKLATELHDEVGTNLAALKMIVAMLKRIDNLNERNLLIDDVIALIISTSEKLTTITMEMRNVVLENLGIIDAIESYTKDFGKWHKVKIVCDIATDIKMEYDTSLVIYRVMQQALHNILQHAEADRVNIKLHQTKTSFEFIIRDNGKGITQQKIISKTSFGIMGMRERVEDMGGSFQLKGSKIHGTTLLIKLPLNYIKP